MAGRLPFIRSRDDKELASFHNSLISVFTEWTDEFGDEWINHVPSYQAYVQTQHATPVDAVKVVTTILSKKHFHIDDDWEQLLISLRIAVVQAVKRKDYDHIEQVIAKLENISWFYNWTIFYIQCIQLSQDQKRTDDQVQQAFTFLVRDLDPSKGTPRAMDLYKQRSIIHKSFYDGLSLCSSQDSVDTCLSILYRVTETTVSGKGVSFGPLLVEEYLEIVKNTASLDFALKEFEDHHTPLASRRVYSSLTTLAFTHCQLLVKAGKQGEAKTMFEQAIQYMTAYGYRKDRTLSQILYAAVPYQQQYGSLTPEWFFDIYQLSITVASHTDGRSTNSYPIEWFDEFIKVFPKQALQFLASETLDSSRANYHSEAQLYSVLEDHSHLFNATMWFLLVRTIPLASSEKIMRLAIEKLDDIDPILRTVYVNWMQTLPELSGITRFDKYSKDIVDRYKELFGEDIGLQIKHEQPDQETHYPEQERPSIEFPKEDLESALAYIEEYGFFESEAGDILSTIETLEDSQAKLLIRTLISKNIWKMGSEKKYRFDHLFDEGSDYWLYTSIVMFVYYTDGWSSGLHEHTYLEQSYTSDPEKTIFYLQEILGFYFQGSGYSGKYAANLISSLSKLGLDEEQVRPLLELVKEIVSYRLPDTFKAWDDTTVYNSLEGFTDDELTASLLISRLKTLTTLKNQQVVFGISYLSEKALESLLKPLEWAFRNSDKLLPIHRAYLLQVLIETYQGSDIPDSIVGVLVSNYPTGYFLEDWIVYELLEKKLDKCPAPPVVMYPHDKQDEYFLALYNIKYYILNRIRAVSLSGIYNAFKRQRQLIQEEYGRWYTMDYERLVCSIVANSNAVYTIVNQQFYDELWKAAEYEHLNYFPHLHFYTDELVMMVGSLSVKPKWTVPIEDIQDGIVVEKATLPPSDQEWIVLGSRQRYVVVNEGSSTPNTYHTLETTHWAGVQEPDENTYLYSKAEFLYSSHGTTNPAVPDQPVCYTDMMDTFEDITLMFASRYVLYSLDLSLSDEIYEGLRAVNAAGESVITFSCWKEQFAGSINDGVEHPKLTGCSVQIRADYYERFLALFDEQMWIVRKKSSYEW